MTHRVRNVVGASLLAVVLSFAPGAVSQEPAVSNWPAPPYWSPPVLPPEAMQSERPGDRFALQVLALPSPPLPFVAIAPCRLADTRAASGFPPGYGPPSMPGLHAQRSFVITGVCGIPADAQAVSFNFSVWTPVTRGDIRVFPAGGGAPTVATMLWEANILGISNAAIVPLGTGGAITVQVDGPGTIDLIVDVNGYYSPLGVVRTVNTFSGDLTLAPGTNISITPSGGNTLTITNTGGGGGGLPVGSAGQTLRHNGTSWLASSLLYNDGTRIGIGTTAPTEQLEITGNLALPDSTASSGQIRIGGDRSFFILGNNILIGKNAGNFTMTGGATQESVASHS